MDRTTGVRVDLELRYEHDRWRARGAGIDIVHTDLRALEALIAARLRDARAPLHVQINFDAGAMPSWIRQYHGHYRNYVLHVPPRGGL
jgi:hypothetical protein